jgi:hypothetical protein
MRTVILAVFFLCLTGISHSQESKSLIDRAPDIIHLGDFLEKPIKLQVKENTDVFSDKNAKNRIGTLLGDQSVQLEAMTEWAYKVRGKGEKYGIVGWVNPRSFDCKEDTEFIEHLKQIYKRQLEVQALIEAKKIALGMTPNEVSQAIGKPTKMQTRQTANGISARWEYVVYEEIKHYDYIRDPSSGQVFRQLSYISKEEKSRKNVDFENGVVTAIEDSEQKTAAGPKIVSTPFFWRE